MPSTEKDEHLKYVIFLRAVGGAKLKRDLHLAHARHLEELDKRGILELAGPFIEHNSGMIVVNADSKEEAIRIAESDPFITHAYRTYEIRTLEECCKENNFRKSE